jgi:hypothetical protein
MTRYWDRYRYLTLKEEARGERMRGEEGGGGSFLERLLLVAVVIDAFSV